MTRRIFYHQSTFLLMGFEKVMDLDMVVGRISDGVAVTAGVYQSSAFRDRNMIQRVLME